MFLSSQTDKLMAGTKFSDYLGLNHCKKAKKIKDFIHLDFAYWPQSLSTYHGGVSSVPFPFRFPFQLHCELVSSLLALDATELHCK